MNAWIIRLAQTVQEYGRMPSCVRVCWIRSCLGEKWLGIMSSGMDGRGSGNRLNSRSRIEFEYVTKTNYRK